MSNAERMKDISNSEPTLKPSPAQEAFLKRHPEFLPGMKERKSKVDRFLEKTGRQQKSFPNGEYSISKMSKTLEEIPLTNSTSQNHSFPGASKPLKGSGKLFEDPEWKKKQVKYMGKYQVQEIPKFQRHPAGDYTEAATKVPAKMRLLDKERKEILDKTMKEPAEKEGAFKEAHRAMTHKKDRW